MVAKFLERYLLKKAGERPEGLSNATSFSKETFGTVCTSSNHNEKREGCLIERPSLLLIS